jgi:hypothetical protein
MFLCFEVLLDFFHQDLPGVIADEELARFLHLKELDDTPYMFHAVSAYDGWALPVPAICQLKHESSKNYKI